MANVADLEATLRGILRDADADVYAASLIYDALFDAELMVFAQKPESTAMDVDIPTVDGARQSLPAGYPRLLDIRHNGQIASPGSTIRQVAREHMDLMDPDWRQGELQLNATEYAYDERQPAHFDLYPPVLEGFVVGSLCKQPVPYSDPANDVTTVSDEYLPPLKEWALYRLFSEDTEGTVNEARSRKHYGNFFNFFGVKIQNESRVSPRQPENKV